MILYVQLLSILGKAVYQEHCQVNTILEYLMTICVTYVMVQVPVTADEMPLKIFMATLVGTLDLC